MHQNLYKPKGSERVAVVRTLPSSSGAGLMVQVAKGASRKAMLDVVLYGPFSAEDALKVLVAEAAKLKAQGFARGGLGDLLSRLDDKRRRRRALAAQRLGFLGEAGAVDPLLALAGRASEELAVVLDALGRLGDPRAVPVARAAAERKLLSKRRSGVEALRNLGDKDGLSEARTRAFERLPASIAAILQAPVLDRAALEAGVRACPLKDRGLAIDTLYELDLPGLADVVRAVLTTEEIERPHLFRYAKSVWKRSMLRGDFTTFALLSTRIERLGREHDGESATVKSGYDGETKKVRIFGTATVRYVRRAAWRYLRTLAHYRPRHYAYAAAELLVHTTTEDQELPRGLYGSFSNCHAFSEILFGGSALHTYDARTLRHRLKKASAATSGGRDEAYPELWDLEPRAYLRVLGGATLAICHERALAAIEARHPTLIERATHAEVVALLRAPYGRTVELGARELRRRFDPTRPDFDLLATLLADVRPVVRELGVEWLNLTAGLWALDPIWVRGFLKIADAAGRAVVVGLVRDALASGDPAGRRALAEAMLVLLDAPEQTEGGHDGPAEILAALGPEVASLLSLERILDGLANGTPSAQAAYARALEHKEGAERLYTPVELAALGAHENAALRSVAHAFLRRRIAELAIDPLPLFALLESEWDDARAFAVGAVRELDPQTLTPEALMGLCDSSHREAQALGRTLVEALLAASSAENAPAASVDPRELIRRLTEHPDRFMRGYALELVVRYLRAGYVPLAPLEEFFRSLLLDAVPDRKVKERAIAFLGARGLRDASQAELAARLLVEAARSKTRRDAEPALAALAEIRIAFPEVANAAVIAEGAA